MSAWRAWSQAWRTLWQSRPARLPEVRGLAATTAALCLLMSGVARAQQEARPTILDAPGLGPGLTFYLRFESTVVPAAAAGSEYVEPGDAQYVDGVSGNGVAIEAGPVSVPARLNFHREAGTLAFWVRPSWDPRSDKPAGHRVLFGSENFQLTYYVPTRQLLFMTGRTLPVGGFKWDYGVGTGAVADWKPGDWHHVAITWDAHSGRKEIYMDGELAAGGHTEWIRDDPIPEGEWMHLGSREAPGGYDEWLIWDRVLPPEAVALLARRPQDTVSFVAWGGKSGPLANLPRRSTDSLLRFGPVKMPPENTIVEPGATIRVSLPVRNDGQERFSGRVTLTLLDFRGHGRAEEVHELGLGPSEEGEFPAELTAPERGVFKVQAEFGVDGRTFVRDVYSFAAWPRPSGPPDPDSFFGNHVNSWYDGQYLDQAARLGLGWMRGHNMLQATWWTRVEPEPGEFDWTSEFQIDHHRSLAMPMLGQLFGVPYWADRNSSAPRPRSADEYPRGLVPKLEPFREYVRQTVSHYKGSIHHWEIMNEPEVYMFWRGTPEEFAEVCDAAAVAAREADPTCTVMAAGFTSSAWDWHERAAKAGALRHMDAISFHFGCPLTEPEEICDQLREVVDHFRRLGRDYGPGGELPLWNTEGGTDDTTWLRGLDYPGLTPPDRREPLDARLGAIRTVQAEVLMQRLGIVRHFIYLQNAVPEDAGAFRNTSMLEVTNAPRPKLIARVALEEQVRGARCVDDVYDQDNRFWAFVYERPGPSSVVVWWTGSGGRLLCRAFWPGEVTRQVDFMGNERPRGAWDRVSDVPSYVHIDGPADKVLAALRAAEILVYRRPDRHVSASAPHAPDLPDDMAAPGPKQP
jgi:hypothetical protein